MVICDMKSCKLSIPIDDQENCIIQLGNKLYDLCLKCREHLELFLDEYLHPGEVIEKEELSDYNLSNISYWYWNNGLLSEYIPPQIEGTNTGTALPPSSFSISNQQELISS